MTVFQRFWPVFMGFCAICLIPAAAAQAQDSVAQGAALAARQCAECHTSAPPLKPGAVAGPSFRDIAQKPVMTKLAIRVFMRTTHPNMPDIILTDDEIDSIADYIHSLK